MTDDAKDPLDLRAATIGPNQGAPAVSTPATKTPRKLAPDLEALAITLELLEPLTLGGRARVILAAMLQLAPDAVTDEQLVALLREAKKP